MMNYSESYFLSSDGVTPIHVNHWVPTDRPVRGVVQIAHGVAEYGKRYAPFAEFLCAHGFAVVANDHLGHGKSGIANAPKLYFGENDGWWHAVDDMETLRRQTAQEFLGKPYFLFGHSMGSFLSRSYLIRWPGKLDGCILCGTGNPSPAVIAGGKLVTNHEIRHMGKKAYSARADALAFGSYNKKFRPNRTLCDWVSASEANVDAYIVDPQCGGNVSVGLLRDILEGLSYITDKSNLEKMERTMPVLFIAGQNDPVGDMGKGVHRACENFQKAGMMDVQSKLYPGMRHEILNEEAKTDVYRDVLLWLEKRC